MGFRFHWWGLAAVSLFLLAGQPFLPLLGFEEDEALFASAVLQPRGEIHSVQIGHAHVATMLLSYLGALKSWILGPLIRNVRPSVWVVREPALLAGAASVWLFYLLLRRIAGRRAAVLGALLLAADPLYLLTTCFDWGPVALQHLLITAGLYLLVAFYQDRGTWRLAGAFFLFGLALWDKALALWMLSGLAVAAAMLLRSYVARVLTLRRIGIALSSFAMGCAPLLIYNLQTRGATMQGNFTAETSTIAAKALLLSKTLSGQALFGYLSAEDAETPAPRAPQGWLQRVSAGISNFFGHPRHTLGVIALLAAVLLAPLADSNGRRTVGIAAIAIAVAWIQMALTANAGASVHHTILLWPLPVMIVAVSLAAASRRLGRVGVPLLGAVAVILAAPGAAVTNEYHAQMVRNGGSTSWTEALFPAVRYLSETRAAKVFCVDWGMLNGMRLASRGRLPLAFGTLPSEQTAEKDAILRYLLSSPDYVFVAHTREAEFLQGSRERLIAGAATLGYRPSNLAVIDDAHGRHIFEVFRFRRSDEPELASGAKPD